MDIKIFKKKFVIMSVLLMCTLGVYGCAHKNEETTRTEKQVIKELIDTFDVNTDNAQVKDLLKELEKINSGKAKAWKSICDIWAKAYREGYVNADILPDKLPEDDSLGIVVLGFELNPDGSMKDELIGRLSTAYDCALKYPKAYIIMTGGGTAANNKSVTEADSMAEWMIAKGIDRDRIIIENKSLTTLENADNTFGILESSYPTVKKLAIVTSDYHVPWGVVNFDAVIWYEAYTKGLEPAYEIISNAGYKLEVPTYSFEEINQYQKQQLWKLETMFN